MQKLNWIFNKIVVFFLIFIIISNNTLGYDLYHHVISIYSIDSINQLNYYYDILEFKVPRYILFHYIFSLLTSFGIGLIFYNSLIYTILSVDIIGNLKDKNLIIQFLFPLILLLAIFFWSPISVTVISLISYFITKNKFIKNLNRLIITCFHPIGLLISIILLFTRDRIFFNYIILTLISIALIQDHIYIGTCGVTSEIQVLKSIEFLIDKVLISKLKELLIIIFSLALLFYANRKKTTGYIQKIKHFKIYVLFVFMLLMSSLTLTTISLTIPRKTIYNLSDMIKEQKKLIKMAYFKTNLISDNVCYYSKFIRKR